MSSAVLVRVVAAEEDTRFVAIDDLGEPADGLTSGSVTEVLLVDLRRVAPAENVVASLTADGNGLVKTVPDVGMLGRVAGRVNRVVVDGTSIPGGSGRGHSGSGDGDGSSLTRNKRGGRDSRSSSEQKRGEASHCGE